MYHVVAIKLSGALIAEFEEAISAKLLAVALVVDHCHLYSSVPVCPEAAAMLVNAAGVVPEQMVCEAAIVPPEVGLVQPVVVIVLFGLSAAVVVLYFSVPVVPLYSKT